MKQVHWIMSEIIIESDDLYYNELLDYLYELVVNSPKENILASHGVRISNGIFFIKEEYWPIFLLVLEPKREW